MSLPIHHPQKDEHGMQVEITQPSTPTALEAWGCAGQQATVVPGGAMPPALLGVNLTPWTQAPSEEAGWSRLAEGNPLQEPSFDSNGQAAAAGVVILEDDGRIWAVSPTNRFGGYTTTFPKGKVEPGLTLPASALKETFEESGLRVELIAHLADVSRSTSRTRYYLARRVGGSPSAMGWESQAVHLIPRRLWAEVLAHANDQPILEALNSHLHHSN